MMLAKINVSQSRLRPLFVATLAFLMAVTAVAPTSTASEIGITRKVIKQAIAQSLNKRLKIGDGLAFNETVTTGAESAVEILFTDESKLILGENAEIILDSMIYNPNQSIVKGTFRVITGILRFKSAQTRLDMIINTPTGTIGIRGTEFDLLTSKEATEITMYEGVVQVTSAAGTATVSRGQTYRMSATSGGFLDAPSPALEQASTRMLALIATQGPETAAVSSSATAPSAATTVTSNTAAPVDNRILMELASGPVLIEMRPDLAPKHIQRVRELIKKGAFDGLQFQFVQPGYVAETMVPTDDTTTIPAEFSSTPFDRGTVGMSHAPNDPNGANGKFFIALGRAKVLDGKYTVWGQVVSGMEHLDKLKATRGTTARQIIKSLRVGN
ncbi:MAG: hypothetical protein HOH64_10145 [Rhodospirillales bacterium]|nr:hypothetical protein [Rhodospirillales bacterium]